MTPTDRTTDRRTGGLIGKHREDTLPMILRCLQKERGGVIVKVQKFLGETLKGLRTFEILNCV